MKKRIKLLAEGLALVLCSLACIISCTKISGSGDDETPDLPEKPIREETANYRVDYRYSESTIVLEGSLLDYLDRIGEDGMTLYFREDMPGNMRPKAGLFISARMTEKTPNGLCHKVLSVTSDGGFIKCVCDVAKLDEVFDYLDYEYNGSILDADRITIFDDNGNEVDAEFFYYSAELDTLLTEQEYLEIYPQTKSGKEIVSNNTFQRVIHIDFDPDIDPEMAMYLGINKFEAELFFGADLTISGSTDDDDLKIFFDPMLNVKFLAGWELKTKWKPYPWELYFNRITTALAVGPVVVRPELRPMASLELSAKGSATLHLEKTFKVRAGIDQTRPKPVFTENLTDDTIANRFVRDLSFKGEGEVSYKISPELGVGLYTSNVAVMIRPTAEVKLTLNAALSSKVNKDGIFSKPIWSSDVETVLKTFGDGFIKVEWFKKKWELGKVTFLEKEWIKYTGYIIPSVEEGTLVASDIVPSESYCALNVNYIVSPAVLNILGAGIKAGLKISKHGDPNPEILRGSNDLSWIDKTNCVFLLPNLERNVTYTACPLFNLFGRDFEGEDLSFMINDEGQIEYPKDDLCGSAQHPHYVDLLLPSGTLWACCNVGAERPEQSGDFFAWGEISPKEDYTWRTYKWCDGGQFNMNKYCYSASYGKVDNLTVLQPEDDAATANWGPNWRMPTMEEQNELRNMCDWEWTVVNGKGCMKVTSRVNGNCIYLPAAGYISGTRISNEGSFGYYNSASIDPTNSDDSYYFYFNNAGTYWNDFSTTVGRDVGFSVRPVYVSR